MRGSQLIASLLLSTCFSTVIVEVLTPPNDAPVIGSLSGTQLHLSSVPAPWAPHGNDANHSPMPIREFAKQNGSGFITGGTPLTHL
jgi:hypothetical protein